MAVINSEHKYTKQSCLRKVRGEITFETNEMHFDTVDDRKNHEDGKSVLGDESWLESSLATLFGPNTQNQFRLV